MRRRSFVLGILLAVVGLRGDPARAADPASGVAAAVAVEEALQLAITRAEPSIASIIVARTDAYARSPWLPPLPSPPQPGKLGSFRLPNELEIRQFGLFDPLELNTRRPRPEWRKLDLSDPANVPESYGSGVVIGVARGAEGGLLVLTNYHVVRDATKLYVRLPGDKGAVKGSYADLHAVDPRSDLAVLRLLDRTVQTPTIALGDGGAVRKGQWVLSLANPFAAGFRDGSPSASWGIISNLRRRPALKELNELERTKPLVHYGILLQTDARLNLGCSGGALLNLRGELVGLTTALAAVTGSETSGGFAVPLDQPMRRFIEILKEGREIEYGFLGVNLNPDSTRADGVKIGQVHMGSPAQQAGLVDGVIIQKINGMTLTDTDDLFLAVGTALAGTKVEVVYSKPGFTPPGTVSQRYTTEVTLAKYALETRPIAANRPSLRGLRVDYTSTLLRPNAPLMPIPRGVVISEVESGSRADHASLKVNEIILSINGVDAKNPAVFFEVARGVKDSEPLELLLASSDPSRPSVKVKVH